ncbi:MAG: J domain-containing protein [Gammaproteobacteria bacterium]
MSNIQAWPLQWPTGRPRTPARQPARFSKQERRYNGGSSWTTRTDLSIGEAKRRIYAELERFGASQCVISSNLMLNLDGSPRSGQREPDDPGVAVYFTLKGVQHVMACDKWNRAADNMAAIAKHIDSIRGQLRWGVVDAREAFRGFAALPDPAAFDDWRTVLGFDADTTPTMEQVDAHYRRLAMMHHPDRGGSTSQFQRINHARDRARDALGG